MGRRIDSALGNEAVITVRSVLRLASSGREVGRVDPGVKVERNAGQVAREDGVSRVHADVTVGLSSRSHASGRSISAGVQLSDLDVAVSEVGVRETESEFVNRLNLLLVESSVINEDTLLEVGLRDLVVRSVKDISAVVRTLGGHGERKLSTRVDTTVEDVSDRVTRLLSRNTSPQDGGNVRVVGVLLEKNRADRVDNKNGVVASSRDVGDKLVGALPESEVVAVTEVVVDLKITFSRVRVGENWNRVSRIL